MITFVSSPIANHAGAPTLDLVILNGRVIDPKTNLDEVRKVGIRDGRIVAVTREKLTGKRTLDTNELVVAPGFIDLHSHSQTLPGDRMQAFDGITTALELESSRSGMVCGTGQARSHIKLWRLCGMDFRPHSGI